MWIFACVYIILNITAIVVYFRAANYIGKYEYNNEKMYYKKAIKLFKGALVIFIIGCIVLIIGYIVRII